MPPALWIDHVVAAVPDLDVAMDRLSGLGLASYDDSSAEARSAVCPLGSTYLRVVEDPARPPTLGWAVVAGDGVTTDVGCSDITAPRAPDGLLPRVLTEPSSPRQPDGFRRVGPDPIGVICVELRGDARDLRARLGAGVDELPFRIAPGEPPGVHEVTIATVSGDIRLRSTDLGRLVPPVALLEGGP